MEVCSSGLHSFIHFVRMRRLRFFACFEDRWIRAHGTDSDVLNRKDAGVTCRIIMSHTVPKSEKQFYCIQQFKIYIKKKLQQILSKSLRITQNVPIRILNRIVFIGLYISQAQIPNYYFIVFAYARQCDFLL